MADTPRLRVGLIFGGANSEHEVSCKSAASAAAHLDPHRYEVVLLGIDRAGTWHRVDSIDELAGAGRGSRLPELDGIDVAFPLLHGRFGEDGTVQGMLELAGIPYVGSGVLASALCMDKELTGRVLTTAGIPVVPTSGVRREEAETASDIAAGYGYPVFVKPNRAGSSVGVSKVETPDALPAALEVAWESDELALIQPQQRGAEVDLGVLEHADGILAVGEPLRIRAGAESTFFDYHAKYTPGAAVFEVPAMLAPGVRERLDALALAAFRALGCRGFARIDFFVFDDGQVVLNEVNTIPGMTSLSQYPQIWAAAGIDYPALLDLLLAHAVADWKRPGSRRGHPVPR